MKTLNNMTDEELDDFVKKERLKGTDMEKLLDYVQNSTFESLYRKANLYQFIRAIYKVSE